MDSILTVTYGTNMDTEAARTNMIKQQIRTWDILDEAVLNLLSNTPREDFVPKSYRRLAFADMHIPLQHGQFMMSPVVEGKVIQALEITKQDKILEIGTGSGYITALLAKSGQHVYSIDAHEDFITQATKKLAEHGIDNVSFEQGDATGGWAKQQPYDVICVTGSLPYIDPNLMKELALGGRLFAIVGEGPSMRATLVKRISEDDWSEVHLFETSLPPLTQQTSDKFNF